MFYFAILDTKVFACASPCSNKTSCVISVVTCGTKWIVGYMLGKSSWKILHLNVDVV